MGNQVDLAEIMAKNRNIVVEKKLREETPLVNGYKMVEATPMRQATTYRKNVIEESPMITWGKIEDTIFLGLEKSSNSFKVP